MAVLPESREDEGIHESSSSQERRLSDSSVSTHSDNEKISGWQSSARNPFDPNARSSNANIERPSVPNDEDGNRLTRPRTMTLLGGILKLRGKDDDDPTDWWFASTAIPLLAATFAPMANLLSIAALVVYWRNDIKDPDNRNLIYATSYGTRDPPWCIDLNGASLACGFVGNIFLLCNFTKKIRYIIALPVTIFLFYLASGILIGITAGMSVYDPIKENQVYSQGFWHAIIAACLYMGLAMLLMVNMLGYFLGHYPQHFDLNDEQRNLILQTMIFFIWLGGGAGMFASLEDFPGGYSDALYFCIVTLLTIGFGDIVATNDVGRGLVFPYTVGGTIILGLMVSSIHRFAAELSKEKVIKQHIETRRVKTLERAINPDSAPPTDSATSPVGVLAISRPLEATQIQQDIDEKARRAVTEGRTIGFALPEKHEDNQTQDTRNRDISSATNEPKPGGSLKRTLTLERVTSLRYRIPLLTPTKNQKAILMKSEKDRFDKMRDIQAAAKKFKKWYALTMSVLSFGILWCVGAVVFWIVEAETQGLTYFQSLYFCYVSLLTIGYGDLSPRSNAGKAFFVFWALVAVPTMTILVSDLGDTAIGGFKRKVLEYGELAFLGKGRGWGLDWFTQQKKVIQRRLSSAQAGIAHRRASVTATFRNSSTEERHASRPNDAVDAEESIIPPRTIADLLEEDMSEMEMTRRLAHAIQGVATDMRKRPQKRYSYEEWVEFTRLIRYSRLNRPTDLALEYDEALDGVIEWDWLDSNSPMTSEQSEPEWVLDRLHESLIRIFRRGVTLPPQTSHSHRAALNGDDGDDSPLWSKRGKARLQNGDKATDEAGTSIVRRDVFSPAAGFHGRLKGAVSNTD